MKETTKYPHVKIQLTGEDGNAFFILGRVIGAAKRAGLTQEEITKFEREATSGDYNHLLRTCMEWFDCQ